MRLTATGTQLQVSAICLMHNFLTVLVTETSQDSIIHMNIQPLIKADLIQKQSVVYLTVITEIQGWNLKTVKTYISIMSAKVISKLWQSLYGSLLLLQSQVDSAFYLAKDSQLTK